MTMTVQCPLCGTRFEKKGDNEYCKACHLFKKCGLILCPNCGYEIPDITD